VVSEESSYTLIRTLGANPSQLLAVGSFRHLAAEFEAVAGLASGGDYVPVEVEVVLKWSHDGAEPDVFLIGPEPRKETWILNLAAVLSLTEAEVR
jgi:hypothetical protein